MMRPESLYLTRRQRRLVPRFQRKCELMGLGLGLGLPGGGGGREYTGGTPQAVDYDGAADYATRGAGLTGIADGKQGTLSFWFRPDGSVAGFPVIFGNATTVGGGTPRFDVYLGSGGEVGLFARNAAGTEILNIFSSSPVFNTGSNWYHVLISWDLADPNKRHIYLSDAAATLTVTTYTNDAIDYTVADWALAALANGGQKYNGCLSEVWFDTTYIDATVEANRRKFITANGKPALLGTNGSLPTGSQPKFYSRSGDATANLGSGGNFTNVSAPDAASTSPFAGSAFTALNPITPSMLSDNGYSENLGSYYTSSAFARLVADTDARAVRVSWYVDPDMHATGSPMNRIGVWDGTTKQEAQATGAGSNTATFYLAPGSKTVSVVAGPQTRVDGVGIVSGNYLTSAQFFGQSFCTPKVVTPASRIVVYGDSISTGFIPSAPTNNSWTTKLRALYSGSVMNESWGFRSLREDGVDATARQALADRIAGYSPTIIWLAIGTNDYFFADWNAADFGAAYADLLDKLHAAAPGATIWAQSPIDRTTESANALGSTLPNYRTQIQNACAARPWCNFSDGTAYLNPATDLADGVHPNTVGHELYYASVATALGISPGTLQFSASNYNVNDNAGSVTITVTRTGGSAGAIAVNYATSNGTATQPGDYTATSGQLNWANGETAAKTFQVPIVNDLDAGSETVNLTLSSPTNGAALGVQRTATITIVPSI